MIATIAIIIGIVAYLSGGIWFYQTWSRYYEDTHVEPELWQKVLMVFIFLVFWVLIIIIIALMNAGTVIERFLKKIAERL